MNEQQLDQKIQQDATRMNRDLDALKEDGSHKVNKVGEDLNRTTEKVADQVNGNMAQFGSEFKKVKGDASETVAHVTATVVRRIGNGLSQYNAKVTEVAKDLPGDFGAKAGKYPWVAISFALLLGFLLRGLFMPDWD